MDLAELLALFDRFERRDARSFGVRREATPTVVRHVGEPGAPSWVLYSRLEGADADAVIQGEIAYFRALGQPFEWKHYDHDRPADLRARLVAAGFELDEEEQLLVLDLAGDAPPAWLAAGAPATVRDGGADLVDDLVRVADVVWPEHAAWIRSTLTAEATQAPAHTRLFVAYDDARPVAAAWTRWTPDSPFLSLFGAATLPQARGRGHYRALVTARARHARALGARYLSVEAGPMSAPILTRLGFVHVAITTPCHWRPAPGAAPPGEGAGPARP